VNAPPAAGVPRERRSSEIRRVLVWTFVANVAVVLAKAIAGVMTGTLSVVADAAHSSVDALNNVLALALARVAGRAPDERHPYGHAKFETLGALAVVAFLSITVFELLERAITRLITDVAEPSATPMVMVVMAGSAVVSWVIARYERRQGRALRSELLVADAAHTSSDVYSSIAVLVGLGFVALGFPRADAVATIIVAAVIARAGWRILGHTVPVLVDERAAPPTEISRLAREVPGVIQCVDIRSRGREGDVFVELTITVDGGMDVHTAHEVADEVERRIARAVGARDVIAHVEPAEQGQSG